MSQAILVLEDGRTFRGEAYGAVGTTVGEAVFATGMTGYQETLTDPSYAGQIVTMTAPHIGNTGITPEDDEAPEPVAAGIVVKWNPTEPSNWRSTSELTDWMARRGRIGIGGITGKPVVRRVPLDAVRDTVSKLADELEGYEDLHASAELRRDILRNLAPVVIEEALACAV